MHTISINYPAYQDKLQFSEKEGKRYLFDPFRKKHIVVTPEEVVRQLFLHYLVAEKNYPSSLIAVEKQVTVHGRKKRFDILVYDKQMNTILLAECKAPYIAITNAVFEQVAWYNYALRADYLVATNGLDTYCCAIDFKKKSYRFIKEVPEYVL